MNKALGISAKKRLGVTANTVSAMLVLEGALSLFTLTAVSDPAKLDVHVTNVENGLRALKDAFQALSPETARVLQVQASDLLAARVRLLRATPESARDQADLNLRQELRELRHHIINEVGRVSGFVTDAAVTVGLVLEQVQSERIYKLHSEFVTFGHRVAEVSNALFTQ